MSRKTKADTSPSLRTSKSNSGVTLSPQHPRKTGQKQISQSMSTVTLRDLSPCEPLWVLLGFANFYKVGIRYNSNSTPAGTLHNLKNREARRSNYRIEFISSLITNAILIIDFFTICLLANSMTEKMYKIGKAAHT